MSIGRKAIDLANSLLAGLNLELSTRTVETTELARLANLERSGHFSDKAFPVTKAMENATYGEVLDAVREFSPWLSPSRDPNLRTVGFTFDNDYFSSPDAEVLYSAIRRYRPATIIEVGSGNSTRIARLAINDGGLNTRLVSIDPNPRIDVVSHLDSVHRCKVEAMSPTHILSGLNKDDILFIDSSHMMTVGGDLPFLYFWVLPFLQRGVLVHIHDVFLPFEYPRDWVVRFRWPWNESALVQAMLAFGDSFEVMWPGHYLQRTQAAFADNFPRMGANLAKSLWLRKA